MRIARNSEGDLDELWSGTVVEATGMDLSPDGCRAAVLYVRDGQPVLSMFDLQARRAVTFELLETVRPEILAWSPDASMLASGRARAGCAGRDGYLEHSPSRGMALIRFATTRSLTKAILPGRRSARRAG